MLRLWRTLTLRVGLYLESNQNVNIGWVVCGVDKYASNIYHTIKPQTLTRSTYGNACSCDLSCYAGLEFTVHRFYIHTQQSQLNRTHHKPLA